MLQNRDRRTWIGFLLVLLLVITNITFHQFINFPSEIRLFQGEGKKIQFSLPVSATATVLNPQIVHVNGSAKPNVPVMLDQPFAIHSDTVGQTRLTLKLFGKLPIKQMMVRVLPDVRVIPGGQSIGIKMKSDGVLVVGHDTDSDQVKEQIQKGDYLLEVDHQPIKHIHQLAQAAKKAGKKGKDLHLLVLSSGKKKTVKLRPFFDQKEKIYRLGLYIRDSAAGVGTLTFFDPKKQVYGALGHMITDMDTAQPIRVGSGKLIHSSVTSIQKGESGEPGEKRAIFFDESRVLGNIVKNTSFGIFGKMLQKPNQALQTKPVPIALAEEVKEGPAKILTVIEGQKVEAFDVQIVHAMKQTQPATKGLIIKVTDKRLLEKTGGIVQGMSGSPILQNGKLIGAVTHVFVNDPGSGYGTYIEWMLKDAGVLKKEQTEALNQRAFFFCRKRANYVESII